MERKVVRAVLDWMLSRSIITYNEYNTLIIKALPFTKG